jgi:uridine kinase
VDRTQLVDEIAEAIARVERPHPVRVAIDGVSVAGKTILAKELVSPVERRGRPVIRASVDGFHNPRRIRQRRGGRSSEGYYLDSFDYEALKSALLEPLGPDGNLKFRSAVFDFRTDSGVETPVRTADPSAVLLFDGIFLLRPELREHWDFRIFVDASFEVTVGRALTRDIPLFGTREAVLERYELRYVPGERRYLEDVNPADIADCVVANDDPLNPTLQWSASRQGAPIGGTGGSG